MKIVRRAYESVVNDYTLNVDQEYCDELSKCVNEKMTDSSKNVNLTFDDIAAIINGDWDRQNEKVDFTYRWVDEENIYTAELGYFIYEIIDDDLWGCDYEFIDGETHDYETFVHD